MTREIARQEVARDHDADRRAGCVARDGAGTHELAPRIERLVRRVGAAGRDPRRQPIGGRAQVPLPHRRRLEGEHRRHLRPRTTAGLQAIDFDHADAPVHDGCAHRTLQRLEISSVQRVDRERLREQRRLRLRGVFAVTIERTGDGVRRRQYI